MKKAKRKNSQDLTLRNLHAMKKRLAALEYTLLTLIAWMSCSSVAPISGDEAKKLAHMLDVKS